MSLTLQQRIDRGRRAEELKADPLLSDAVDSMREAVYDEMRKCSLRDRDGMAILHQKLKVIDMFGNALSGFMADADWARREWDKAQAARTDGPIKRAVRRVI